MRYFNGDLRHRSVGGIVFFEEVLDSTGLFVVRIWEDRVFSVEISEKIEKLTSADFFHVFRKVFLGFHTRRSFDFLMMVMVSMIINFVMFAAISFIKEPLKTSRS